MLFVTMFINFVLNGIRLEFIILPLISFLYLWNFHFFINIILICICVLFFLHFWTKIPHFVIKAIFYIANSLVCGEVCCFCGIFMGIVLCEGCF